MSTLKHVFQQYRAFYWPTSLNGRVAVWFGFVCGLGVVWLSFITPTTTPLEGLIVALAVQLVVQISTRRFLDRLWPDE